MEQWQRNLEVIRRGKGSDQARHHDRECPICNNDKEEEDENNKEV
jgi:galactose-1-phosphate uridylyltransferase